MKSEGSQHVYSILKTAVMTVAGNRIMIEKGNIKGLEIDDTKNYILIPIRITDKDGKEKTSSWSIHEIHPDADVNYKLNEDGDKWIK